MKWRPIETSHNQVAYYEAKVPFGVGVLCLTARFDTWEVTLEGGTPVLFGKAQDFEEAREQAVSATRWMLADTQKWLLGGREGFLW